jgi:hypothetical protein
MSTIQRKDNTANAKNDNNLDDDEFTSILNKLSVTLKKVSWSDPENAPDPENVITASSSVFDKQDLSLSGNLQLKTLHISCFSDSYDSSSNYIGIIFYGNRILNRYKVHPGYIVLKKADDHELLNLFQNTRSMHGSLFQLFSKQSYRSVCTKLIEGFAYKQGVGFCWKSNAFNRGNERVMNPTVSLLVERFLEKVWFTKQFPETKLIKIQELLSLFNVSIIVKGEEVQLLCK